MKYPQTAALALISALLLGCGSTGKTDKEGLGLGNSAPETGKYPAGVGTGEDESVKTYGVDDPNAANATNSQIGASPNDTSGPLSQRIIYFEYDSSEVRQEYLPIINNHANYLAANPGKSVVLQGHADERGSPEYNIALGEQRAKTVAQLMKLQGVTDTQIQTVSFGEEKPQDLGHDDSAWQQNRRVEIAYPEQ